MITKSPITSSLLFNAKKTFFILFFDKINFSNYCKILTISLIFYNHKCYSFFGNQRLRFFCTQKLWSKANAINANFVSYLYKKTTFTAFDKRLLQAFFFYQYGYFYLEKISYLERYSLFHSFCTHNFNFLEKITPTVLFVSITKLVEFFSLRIADQMNFSLGFKTFIFVYFIFLVKKCSSFIFLENISKRPSVFFSGTNLRYSFSSDLVEYNWNLL